jgi:hemolysin D
MQRQFLTSQVAEHRAKVAALDKQRVQKEAERSTTAATITKLESTLPVVQQRVDIRGALYNREFGSKLQYLETLQLLIEQQQDLGVQKSKLAESEAAVAARDRFLPLEPVGRPRDSPCARTLGGVVVCSMI